MTLLYIIIFIGACIILIKSGTWAVKSLIKIARSLEWSEFSLTFIFMALTTSLPELFIGLNSALHKVPQLSFGNIIGVNIFNLTIGVAGVIIASKSKMKLKTETIRTASFYAALFICFPLILMLDGTVSRFDGIILLICLIFYFRKIIFKREKFKKIFRKIDREEKKQSFKIFLRDLGIFFGSLALLLLSAEGIVRSANFLALEINLPLVATGIVFIALGTALPELIFGMKSVKMRREEMALGDFLGTVVINSTLILGIVSIISPLKITSFLPYVLGIAFTFVIAAIFYIFSKTNLEISKREAYILMAVYIVFIFLQFAIN